MIPLRIQLRAEMFRQKRTPKWVAISAGVSSAAVCKALAGDAISPRLALAFEEVLGVGANHILRRQAEEQMAVKLDRQRDQLDELRLSRPTSP